MVVLIFSQLAVFKNVIKSGGSAFNLLMRITNTTNNAYLYSTKSNDDKLSNELSKKESHISDAMMAYLERAKAYDEFMQKEEADYDLGKQHLANMMGENPETFTQSDVNQAIKYLFPSGLYDKRARPIMDHPKNIIPPKRAAEFDDTGRPFHSLFYTTKPNYYQILYDIVEHMNILNDIEDEMLKNNISAPTDSSVDLSISVWMTYDSFKKYILEEVTLKQYEYFITSIERLAQHPYSNKVESFINNFRKSKKSTAQSIKISTLKQDENGRPFITIPDCMRKSARGSVTVRGQGEGKIIVNGILLTEYFHNFQEYEQIIFPLHFTDMLNLVDVEATINGGGPSGQAGAIRWGIAMALRSFVSLEMVQKMKIAGLLTRDWRIRERKKPGQEGARRKFTWKKR